jgi:glyoxalase family protein
MQLHGIHHLTAVSADAPGNYAFYTRVMGMRLVKKTVNQDDVSAYHLFYADGAATPGTDLTFFDWPVAREKRGTHSITRTSLRVAGEEALAFWADRLSSHKIAHSGIRPVDGRLTIDFEDPEGQRLALVDDSGEGDAHPWARADIDPAFQIRGLGPIRMSVPDLVPTDAFLSVLYEMRRVREYQAPDSIGKTTHVYEMGKGGPAAELHVTVEPSARPHQPGAGSVHHVAFRCADDAEYKHWIERYQRYRIPSSGPVDRYYFKSLYTREPNGILFEIATDGPGFATDEPFETMGERLALPPFLEPKRAMIEAGLKPL